MKTWIYKYLLVLFLAVFSHPGTGATKLDSLLRTYGSEKADTLKIKTGLRIASNYLRRGIADSGAHYARLAYALSKKNNFLSGLGSASNYLGQASNYLGRADSAIYFFNEAMVWYKKANDKSREVGMLNNLGVVYNGMGQIQKALDCYFKYLKIEETLKDTNGIANAYTNIGEMYSELNDTTNTLKYHLAALDLRKKIGDASGESASLVALGSYYQNRNQLTRALSYLTEGLKICEQLGEEESIAISCYNVASVYLKQGRVDSAIKLYQRSLALSRKNKNKKGIAVCLETLGEISSDKKDYQTAIAQLEEARQVAIEIELNELLGGICGKLSQVYEKTGNFKLAIELLKQSEAIKDSIFNKDNIRKLTSEGLKYEHEKEKLLLQKEQERKEELAKVESARKNFILGVSVLFLIVVSVFSYTLYKRLVENKKQKKIIEEQRNETLASINYARRIQYALLAHDNLLEECLPSHFVLFKPKDIVSGDFYWAVKRNDYVYFAVCDCTGHGVPGAFMSLLNISFLNEAITEKGIAEPGKIFDHVRQRLIENMDGGKDGMDAILLKLPLNRSGNATVEYAAANNLPLLVRNNTAVALQKDRMPVGLGEKQHSFSTFSIELQTGDSLYLYTDGYADQFGGPKGKKFMYRQLDQLLTSNSSLPPGQQKINLEQQFESWKSALEQIDDVCVAGIFWS